MIDERLRIGQRIAEIRKENGMTQEQLATLLDTGQAHIARLEKGKYNAGFDTLQKIATVFNMDVDFRNKGA